MKELKKIRLVAVIAFLVAIASLSVSYSSLNTTKEVKGIAIVEERAVSLKFESVNRLASDDYSSVGEGLIIGNTMNFDCNLSTIGSYCSMELDLINDGTFDVIVNNYEVINIPENSHVSYEIRGINDGDVLAKGETKRIRVKIIYDDYVREEFEEVPVITLKDVQFKVNYEKSE